MEDDYLRIVLIGERGVGKTSLVKRFIEDKFYEKPLLGESFLYKEIEINNNKTICLQFCIHNSIEKFYQFKPSKVIIKDANAIILVYDVSDKNSFEILGKALEYINRFISKEFPIILIGNKIDELKIVTTEEGQNFANNNSLFAFYETSAKDNINVKECFNKLIEKISNIEEEEREKEKTTKKENIIKIEEKKENKEKKKCTK